MAYKHSFVMYDSWLPLFENMSDEDAGCLIKAICAYRHDPTFRPDNCYISAMFEMIREVLDEDGKKYKEVCEKRAEYGRMGGLSKSKHKVAKDSKSKQVKANLADSDSDNDSDKEIKHIYGQYKKVRLTDDELAKLKSDYGEQKTEEAIAFLDEYIEEKHYKSFSHNLALRKWVFNAVEERRQKSLKSAPNRKSQYPQRDDYDMAEIERRLMAN